MVMMHRGRAVVLETAALQLELTGHHASEHILGDIALDDGGDFMRIRALWLVSEQLQQLLTQQ